MQSNSTVVKGDISRGDFHLQLRDSEAEFNVTGLTIKNRYESKTHDYNIQLEIMGYGSNMDEALIDLKSKVEAFEGRKPTKARTPSTGVKPRKIPF